MGTVHSIKNGKDLVDMSSQDIATHLGVDEYTRLCTVVEDKYHQKFGVISIEVRNKYTSVTVALEDNTHHVIVLS